MNPEPVAASFRDPHGFVFERDGILYRQVNEAGRADFEALSSSGLYEALVAEGLLVEHVVVAPSMGGPGAVAVIRPERIGFVSYPYEWSFSEWKDAALATLRAQALALERGMTLRDASAYNVQFRLGRPVLIDTLSFGRVVEGEPWVAYRQFCEHFLAPLALMARRDVRLGALARAHPDGLPLDLAYSLLPRRARMRPSLAVHLGAHARTQRAHASDTAKPRRAFSARSFAALIQSLRGAIERLRWEPGRSAWLGYYDEAGSYAPAAEARKAALIEEFLEEVKPAGVWDLGANTGAYARLASARGIPTVAFDIDPACVESCYRAARARGDEHLLPLVMDLADPSPGLGWDGTERSSLGGRGPAEMAFALALVHHLAIGRNVPLDRIAATLRRLCRTLAIEFVPKSDPQVKRMLSVREDVFASYDQPSFEAAFGAHFDRASREPLPESERTLYLMRAR